MTASGNNMFLMLPRTSRLFYGRKTKNCRLKQSLSGFFLSRIQRPLFCLLFTHLSRHHHVRSTRQHHRTCDIPFSSYKSNADVFQDMKEMEAKHGKEITPEGES